MIMPYFRISVAAALLAIATPLAAQMANPALTVLDPRRAAANRAQDEGRQPAEILAFAGVKRGHVVADFMAGGGYYTELLAIAVGPKGFVLSMNPPGFHDLKKWEPLLKAHSNVAPLVRPVHEMRLAPRSVDMIFTHLVFHDLWWESDRFNFKRVDTDAMLANWYSALRPGGMVIIIDHAGPAGDIRATVDKLHRMNPADARAQMERAGFVFDGESSALRNASDDFNLDVFNAKVRGKTDRFVMRFRKPA